MKNHKQQDELFINTYLPLADENTKALYGSLLLTLRKQNKLIEKLKPKSDYFDELSGGKNAIVLGRIATVLNMGIGRSKIFEILRNQGVLTANNQPCHAHIANGHFRIVEQKYIKPDGSTHIVITTLVYEKGLEYIRNILSDEQHLQKIENKIGGK